MFDVLKGILVRYREAKRVHAEKVAQLIAEHSRKIFSDPDAPVAGNPEGDVTITHFWIIADPTARPSVRGSRNS